MADYSKPKKPPQWPSHPHSLRPDISSPPPSPEAGPGFSGNPPQEGNNPRVNVEPERPENEGGLEPELSPGGKRPGRLPPKTKRLIWIFAVSSGALIILIEALVLLFLPDTTPAIAGASSGPESGEAFLSGEDMLSSGADEKTVSRQSAGELESILVVDGERPLSPGEIPSDGKEYGSHTVSRDHNTASRSGSGTNTGSSSVSSGGGAGPDGSAAGNPSRPASASEGSVPSGNASLLPIRFAASPSSLTLRPNQPKTVTLQMSPADCKVTASGYAGITVVQDGPRLTLTAADASKEEGSLILTAQKSGYSSASVRIAVKVDKLLDPDEVANLTDKLYIAINNERIKNGIPAFSRISSLDRGAQTRAEEISINFSNNRPNGTAFYTIYTPGPNYNYGENIAMGYKTPAEALAGWMASPGQRDNILDENYTGIGLGVYKDENGRWFWAEHFYRP